MKLSIREEYSHLTDDSYTLTFSDEFDCNLIFF